ncbi:MAG: hypothetical protein H7067_12375 [Burkholderiales bacterium]|nr:hypothetical protein [Opitutaceae bacterium]
MSPVAFIRVALVFAACASASLVRADEHLFGYVFTSEVIPQGRFGLIQTAGLREGKKGGDYAALDLVSEIEYGLTNRVTIFAAVVNFHHDYSGYEGSRSYGAGRDEFSYGGWDLGAKWMILSPYLDPVGLAVRPQLERREIARLDGDEIDQWTGRIGVALHKNFFGDTLVTALDYVLEAERREGEASGEKLGHEILAGATYRVIPKWFVGFEARYQTDYTDAVFDELDALAGGESQQWAVYAGPSLHYGARRFWATAALLWQIDGADDEDPFFARFGERRHQERHEAWHLRLKIGFPL